MTVDHPASSHTYSPNDPSILNFIPSTAPGHQGFTSPDIYPALVTRSTAGPRALPLPGMHGNGKAQGHDIQTPRQVDQDSDPQKVTSSLRYEPYMGALSGSAEEMRFVVGQEASSPSFQGYFGQVEFDTRSEHRYARSQMSAYRGGVDFGQTVQGSLHQSLHLGRGIPHVSPSQILEEPNTVHSSSINTKSRHNVSSANIGALSFSGERPPNFGYGSSSTCNVSGGQPSNGLQAEQPFVSSSYSELDLAELSKEERRKLSYRRYNASKKGQNRASKYKNDVKYQDYLASRREKRKARRNSKGKQGKNQKDSKNADD